MKDARGLIDDLTLNKWGYSIINDESAKTSRRGVWAGGDIVTGAATVILFLGSGRIAANLMHT